MAKNTATSTSALLANEVGYDPIEDRLRLNIRATIEAVFEDVNPGAILDHRNGRII